MYGLEGRESMCILIEDFQTSLQITIIHPKSLKEIVFWI